MKTNLTQDFWTRKWALQPVRLCCRGKPWRYVVSTITVRKELFKMKLTESRLRVIIKEELKNLLNLSEVGQLFDPMNIVGRNAPSSGGDPLQSSIQKRQASQAAKAARIQANKDRVKNRIPTEQEIKPLEQRVNRRYLLDRLVKVDKEEYVRAFLGEDKHGKPNTDLLAYFVGPEFAEAIQALADEEFKNPSSDEDALKKFKTIAQQFAPMRGSKGICGKITRGLARAVYSPSTKE